MVKNITYLTRDILNKVNNLKSIKFKSYSKNLLAKALLLGFKINRLDDNTCIIVDNQDNALLITDGNWGLRGDCEGLFSDININYININKLNTHDVTDMAYMFNNCQVEQLELYSLDTSNVASMRGMFNGCTVKSLDISNFNTSKVTDMAYMFNNCQVQYLDLSNFDTSNVRRMEYMFSHCAANEINLSSFKTNNVLDLSGMFSGANVSRLDLSNFVARRLTGVGHMFNKYNGETIITDPRIYKAYTDRQVKQSLFNYIGTKTNKYRLRIVDR